MDVFPLDLLQHAFTLPVQILSDTKIGLFFFFLGGFLHRIHFVGCHSINAEDVVEVSAVGVRPFLFLEFAGFYHFDVEF